MPGFGARGFGIDERKQRDGAHAAFRVLENVRHGRGRGGDDREVDGLADVGQRAPATPSENRTILGVDGVERTLEASGDEVLEHRASQGAGALRRADERDRAGSEQRSEGVMHGCAMFVVGKRRGQPSTARRVTGDRRGFAILRAGIRAGL